MIIVIATITTVRQVSDKPQLLIVNTLFYTCYFEAPQLRSSPFSQRKKKKTRKLRYEEPSQDSTKQMLLS